MKSSTEKTCFLLAPIGPTGSEVRRRSDDLLNYVIAPAAAETGYSVIRADQIAAPGLITQQIIRLTLESRLVIADLTGRNPNVLYELGIRHAVGKPVIQMATEGETIPFDIASFRTILVDATDLGSAAQAKQALTQAIRHIEEEPNTAVSPVSAALDLKELQALRSWMVQSPTTSVTSEPLLGQIVSLVNDLDSRMKGLEYRIDRSLTPREDKTDYSRRVFIIHGHDGEVKNELARLLERLDFQPVILHEQPDQGRTVFSKLKGEMADVGFAFVLLTPDDVGALATRQDQLQSRARQNVVFEHGLVVAALSPERVCAIRKGEVEIPSDLQGVLYKTLPPGGGIRSLAIDIANELRAAGYLVDANKLLTL